jgi:putative heme utilization carrier protein HutX
MSNEPTNAAANAAGAARPDLPAIVQAALERKPPAMTVQLARELGVSEAEVIRAFPHGWARELDVTRWEELLRALEPLGDVHVIVTNGAATLEAFGRFGNFSTFGEYFNVQTKGVDMHVRFRQLAAIFAVEKPGHMDGVNTLSFQFYDIRGDAAFKVFLSFGGKPAAAERAAAFAELRERLARR